MSADIYGAFAAGGILGESVTGDYLSNTVIFVSFYDKTFVGREVKISSRFYHFLNERYMFFINFKQRY